MLPVIETDGRIPDARPSSTPPPLLPVALAPTLLGMSGLVLLFGKATLTLLFLGISLKFALTGPGRDARRLPMCLISSDDRCRT